MNRLADLDPSTWTVEQKRVHEAIANGPRGVVRGPLAVWLRRPGLADTAQALGQYCRYGSSLPPRLSELAIVIMGRLWDAAYEWDAHRPLAAAAGIDDALLDAIERRATPVFAKEDEQVVFEFVTTLHEIRRIPEALYRRARELLTEAGVVDLVGIAGYYTLISMTINVFEIASPWSSGTTVATTTEPAAS